VIVSATDAAAIAQVGKSVSLRNDWCADITYIRTWEITDKLGTGRIGDRPADDPAAVAVHHRGQVLT